MRGARPVTRRGEVSNAYTISVLKFEGEIPLNGLGVCGRILYG